MILFIMFSSLALVKVHQSDHDVNIPGGSCSHRHTDAGSNTKISGRSSCDHWCTLCYVQGPQRPQLRTSISIAATLSGKAIQIYHTMWPWHSFPTSLAAALEKAQEEIAYALLQARSTERLWGSLTGEEPIRSQHDLDAMSRCHPGIDEKEHWRIRGSEVGAANHG